MNGFFSFFILCVLTIVAFFYEQWHPGFASTFLFTIFLFLTGYEAVVFMTMFYKLEINRDVEKKRLHAGQSQLITIKIERKIRIPFVWYAAHEQWTGYLSGIPGQMVFPWFRKELVITTEIPDLARGSYELSEITIVAGDMFGLVKRAKAYRITDRFLVLPSYDPLENWSAEDGQRNGHASVAKRIAEELTSVVGVRDYHYGDRLSQVHWKASARGQGLKTKEFEHQTSNHFAVIMDTRRPAFSNKDFEKAVRLTASFVHFGYQRHMKYSLWFDQWGEMMVLEGAYGHDFYRIMEELAVVKREGEIPFTTFIQQALTRIPKGTHLVFVTSKLDPALSKLLMELSMKKWKVEACLISKPSTPNEREWMNRIKGSGVNCYREMA